MSPIAHIYTEFPEKFGIPRQSGIVPTLRGQIIFEPQYRSADALRGLEAFSHIWLIWQFSANRHADWQPLVRPPRLGGNETVGVFATRSPYRPNQIGLSAVKLNSIDYLSPNGPVINVLGADLMSGTPIYDIKPYIVYADSIPNASSGFVDNVEFRHVEVNFPSELLNKFTIEQQKSLLKILASDPRPSYHSDAQKIYGMTFVNYNIRFNVEQGILNVISVEIL